MGKKQVTEAPAEPIVQTTEKDYTPETFEVKKGLYKRDKDTFFADERLYRQDSIGQRGSLGKFFDQVSTPFYKESGVADDNVLKELRDKFINDNMSKLSLAKKKEEEEKIPLEFPDVMDKSQIYSQTYSKQDAIRPIRSDVDVNKAAEGVEAVKQSEAKIAETIPKLLDLPDFNYIKSRPENYMELQESEKKRVTDQLKGMGLSKEERQRAYDRLGYSAETEFINNEKKKYKPEELNASSLKAAEPYITDAEPGTFIDPETGNRKNKAETEQEADQLALINKYQKEIINGIVATSANNPLSKQKDALDEAQMALSEEYSKVEELRMVAQKAAQANDETWAEKTEAWKYAQLDFIKSQKDLEQKIKDFNDSIDQDSSVGSAVSNDPTDKERLQQVVNDAYILKKHWDKRVSQLDEAIAEKEAPGYNGRDEKAMIALVKTRNMLKEKKADATAYFEAASRMAYNNEGPADIKKDAKFNFEVMGDAMNKGFLKPYFKEDKITEREVLNKMGEIGMREGITFTHDEKVNLETSFLEHAMSFTGTLIPDLPGLMLVGSATGLVKGLPYIQKLTKGYKVLRNTALEKEGAIIGSTVKNKGGKAAQAIYKGKAKSLKRIVAFDDPVPTGWQVIREAKPTAMGKVKGAILTSAVNEAAFTGVLGMAPGMISGMNTAHLFLPDIKLKGPVGNLVQPFLDQFYKAAIGSTVGMEAGGITAGMVKAMFTDATFKEEMDNMYPNLDDATKRILAEVAVNGIFFGGMGAMTTASMKAMTAPLGAKYGKYGGGNFTAYFNPKMRARVFEAARIADSKGYTDTAKELYQWLDMTKEPITGQQIKDARIEETENITKLMPVGAIRDQANANRKAIEILESANNDPNFDGYVTLQTQSVEGLKPMDVVKMDERYYEVETIQRDKAGKVLELQLKDIENQEVTKALPEDVNADLHYRINNKMEIAFRLENHYEKLQILNETLAEKGFYGEEAALPEGPPPAKGLSPSTGEWYEKPPEPTKIEKKLKQIQEQEAEMKAGGLEPIELPEKMKKEYVFGVPDQLMDMPVREFSDNLINAGTAIGGQIATYDSQIADYKKKLEDPKFQGRLDLERRREKQEINDEITRLEFAKTKIQPKFDKELSDFYQDAKVNMVNLIKGSGDFTPDEIDDIIQQAWKKITVPDEASKDMTIGEIFDQAIQEYTGTPASTEPKDIAKKLGITYTSVWPGEDGNPDRDIYQYTTPKGNEDTFTMPVGSTLEQVAEKVKEMDAKWASEKPVEPMVRMKEIEDLAKAEGYEFVVNPDSDANMTTLDVYDSSKNTVEWENLPAGIKDLADEFTKLMHDAEIAVEDTEEFKLNGQTFKSKDELFAYLDANAVNKDGSRNRDWFSPDVLPEMNVINAIKEWELSYFERQTNQALKEKNPASWRERGYRIYEGVKYERQEPIKKIETGGNVNIIFSKKDKVPGYFALVDQSSLQPAHHSGQENPLNFIPEAQPRNRGNLKTLSDEARRKAQELDPEQLGFSPNAYTGAPIVNQRGEVIQGNGRVEAIKYYYDTTTRDPKGYIQYLKDNARHFGLNEEDIDRMKEPILVRMVDVNDQEAIRLGNYGMNDIEDVVEGSTHISKATNRMTREQAQTISNIVMQGNTMEDTLNDLIRKNSGPIMKRLVNFNVIQTGDAERFFDKEKNIKPEGIAFVEGLMKGMLFRDANPKTLQSFESLPYMVRMGIEKSIPIILRLATDADITGAVQNAINGIYDFEIYRTSTGETKAGVKAWSNQGDMYNPMPKDLYSPFELALIDRIANAKNQAEIVKLFREYETLVKGAPANLMEAEVKPISKEEAIKKLFGTTYTPTINDELIKQEDEKIEKQTTGAGPKSTGTTPKPAEGDGGKEEITPKEQKVNPVDITKDLKDMTDLLKLLGDPEQGFGAGAGEDMDMNTKVKLNMMATTIVGKFVNAEVYDFPAMLTHIIPQVELPMMKKLLPFLKQGYGALSMNSTDAIMEKLSANLPAVRQFSSVDLDNLIGQMNKPTVEDDFSDVVGKEFKLPNTGKKFTVIRVEQWDDPQDQKIELMEGGLFGSLPKEFEPVLVAVTSDLTQHGFGKEGITLSALREAIKQGKAVFVPPYVPIPERVEAFNKIADELERLGDIDAARIFRIKGTRPPLGPEDKPVSLEDELAGMKDFLDEKMLVLKIKAGEVWFQKTPFVSTTEDMFFSHPDMIYKDEPLEPYIRANVTQEQISKALHFENQRNAWLSVIGMTWDKVNNIPYLRDKFAMSLSGSFRDVGKRARDIANGDKRVKPESLEHHKRLLNEAIVALDKKVEYLKQFIFTWRIKYMLNSGTEIRDAKHLRALANDTGIGNQGVIREQAELALVDLSNRIAQNRQMSMEDRYNRILSLYNAFPKLDVFATSDVKGLQQYSTPAPLGYVMGIYSNIEQVNSILDPTAGNGALVIGANKKGVIVNEIDENRLQNLMAQGYRVLNYDASEDLKGKFGRDAFDAVQTNPPFSVNASGTFAGGFNLKGTHFMVANSLELLADNGKAAIIIGEHTKFESNGRIKGSDLQFFNYLNRHFYVEDVINIPGDFYSKMGTSYPVRLILINGRKPAPEGAAPLRTEKDNPVTSWKDLYDRVQNLTTPPNEKSILRPEVDAIGKSSADVRSGDSTLPKSTDDIGPLADVTDPLSDTPERSPGEGEEPPVRTTPGSAPRVEPPRSDVPDNELRPDDRPPQLPTDPIIRQPANRGEVQPQTGRIDLQPNEPRDTPERTKRTLGLTDRDKDQVIPYVALSRVPGGNSLVPGAMANELEEALMQLKGEVGDIDNYVMGKLKYNSIEDMSSAFYAEQVDGVGMSIFNIENGDATIIGDQTGVGKGRSQPLDAQILTPSGYVRMGDIKRGDIVLAYDGSPSEVIGVFPQGELDIYKIEFTDGTSTECSIDHLWSVKDKYQRDNFKKHPDAFYSQWKLWTTERMMQQIHLSLSIPLVKNIEFESHKELIIDPYLLGVLLGDACMRTHGVELTSADQEIIDSVGELIKDIQKNLKIIKTREYHYQLSRGERGGIKRNKNLLVQTIRDLDLAGKTAANKFIPDSYKFNSLQGRIAILQGLMDTDGYIDSRGICTYSSASRQLADDIQFIVQSLGGIATRGVKKTKKLDCYSVYIKMPNDISPFRLLRKLDRVKDKLKYPAEKYIKSINKIGRKTCQCIKIDHPSSLYITNDFIVTHNTAAGTIAYAVENGYTPVFITKSANLFTDIYRDLIGIGKGHYIPFIMNKEYQGEMTKIYKPNSDEIMFTWSKKDYDNAIDRNALPGSRNVILATYSQFNTDKGNSLKRRDFLMNIASNVVFIMDESHDASGASNTGQFFKDFLARTKGGVFLSATFAKRPDNLPIYAMKTVMREANMTYEDLVEAIAKGGPALQEIISSQLAESIQFTRRQLNMENIERNWYVLGDDDPASFFYDMELNAQLKKDYDGITKIMHEIIQFQRDHVKPVIEGLDEEVKKEGEKAGIKKGTVDMGVSNTPYFSKVFNIVDQLLLAIKVKHVIPLINDSLKAGRKPVITLKSTMEAMIQDLDLDYGHEIETDFRYVLKRGLDGVMRYTVKSANGTSEHRDLDIFELSDMGVAAYKALNEKIKAISTGITISPIDVLIKGITDAGYKVAEITGRHSMFEMDSDFKKGRFAINRRPNKNALINSFNNEPGWVAILNVSGSTGVSMHSSPDYKDTSQRDQFNLQNDLDVNVVIQKEGRTNRTGQVNKPIYNNVLSILPAEKRFAMMTAKKLKSLYANTSSNQKSSKSITEGTTDFLNKYGDEVVLEFLQENPDLNNMMNKPVDLSKDSPEKDGIAHKVTGRVAVLPIETQERFYNEVSERYNNKIDYLNDTGTNDLEVTSEPLNAVTISREVVVQGKGGMSIFGDDTTLETVEVDILKKMLTKREVDDIIEKTLDGKTKEVYASELITQMEQSLDDNLAKKITELQNKHDINVSAKRKESQNKKGSAADIEYWLNDQIEKLDEHHNRLIGLYEGSHGLALSKFKKLFNYFYPGKVLDVPFKADDQLGLIRMNKGIFLGFDINMNKINPFTPSNVMLKFATADSRRAFRIPASKTEHIDSIMANSNFLNATERVETRENWDSLKPSRNREQRFIVTGNILQGMAKYKGRLIEYTMQDGTVKKGILMPENWVNEDEGKIIIPANQAYNIIRALAPKDFVETTSKNVQIQKDEYGDAVVRYNLRVPASRARGEKYWNDKGLKDLVYEGLFQVKGDKMVGTFHEGRLMEVLNYLQSRYGETFEVKSNTVQKNETSQGSALRMINTFERVTKEMKGDGSTHPEREVQGARSKVDMGARISPEPITGVPPKKLWQIEKNFGDIVNQKIFWDRPARRGMAASYTPALGKLVMQKVFMTNLNIAAHELGHRLDDMFGLVGPEAQPMFHIYKQELKELWQFGSEPPKGHPEPLQYQMAEGVAEYFRAFIVNPKETGRRYPMFSRWFEDRVKSTSPKIWEGIQQFSNDVRTFYGASALDQIGANIKFGLEGKEKIPWGWTSLFKPTSKQGNFAITMFDVFSIKMLNSNRAIEKAYRWAMAQSGKKLEGPDQISPRENFIMLSHLLLGHMDKIGSMFQHGVTNVNLERQIDPQTGQPISFPWKFEALPDASIPEMEEFRQMAIKFEVAERIQEAIWKFGAKQVRMDLAKFDSMLPPLEILKKYPHILDKYMPKIERIMDMIDKGDLNEEQVWLPKDRYDFDNSMIIGVGQEGFTDLDVAKKAMKEVREMETVAPEKVKMMKEYARRSRMISMHYVRYMHESGLMSDQLYELITEEDLHYVALHRYYQETGPTEKEVQGFGQMFTVGNDSRGLEGKLHIHALKGSARPIVDPDLIQMEAAFKAILNSDKNNVLRHFVLAFTGARNKHEGEPIQIADVGYIVKGPGQHVVQFYVAGDPMYFKIQDPHVYRGIMQMTDTPNLPKIATFFPRLLRTSVTHSPAFMIRNPIRDFFMDMMIAKTKFKLSDIKSDIGGKELDLAGMGQFGFYIRNYIDYHRMQKEWMFKHSKDPKKFIMAFTTFVNTKWDELEHFMSYSEKVNRIAFAKAEYNKLVKGGMDPYDALIKSAFEARDLLDFHVAGEWMKMINQFIPFSNAAIRGMDKLVRSTRDNPGKVLAWWGLIAVLPSIANSLMISSMDQDTIDEYIQLPPWQRDMFFNIPLGNGRWLTIPKPFELGYLSSGVQRIADKYLLGDNAGITEDWYKLGYNMLFPFDFSAITGGFAGFVHMATGRDFFRDKWVIPPDEMDISVSARNTERATKIGQLLQNASKYGPRFGAEKGEPKWDARMIDDLIQSQLPYYGTYLLKTTEALTGGAKQRAMKFDWSDLGIVKASPVYNAEDVQWVLKKAKRYNLTGYQSDFKKVYIPELEMLNTAIRVYFSEETQADRSKMNAVGKDVRTIATLIRKKWDKPEMNFSKMIEEAKKYK